MSPKWRVRIVVGLAIAVLAASIYFPILKKRVKRAQVQQQTEEQARRELTQSVNESEGAESKSQMFWAVDAEIRLTRWSSCRFRTTPPCDQSRF